MSVDVAIIIPTYNRLWALPRAVDSCRGTDCSVEIIVVDDGSTDGTWEWLQAQPDVCALSSSGWGKPWAVNKAMRHAQGTYIRFLDSDDWLYTEMIDRQLNEAEEAGVPLVVAGKDLYDEEGQFLETQPWVHCDDFIAQQLGECDSSHYSAFLFHRDLIENIPHRTAFPNPDFASRDDRCFMLEVALKEPAYVVTDAPVLCHRHHARGRLQFAHGMRSVGTNLQHLRIYVNVLQHLQQSGRLTLRRRKAAASVLWPLAHWIGYTHPAEAAEVADWVYALDPSFTPPENGVLGWCYRTLGFRRTEQVLHLRRQLLAPFRALPHPSSHTFEPLEVGESPADEKRPQSRSLSVAVTPEQNCRTTHVQHG